MVFSKTKSIICTWLTICSVLTGVYAGNVFAAPVIDEPELDDDTGIVTVSGSVSEGNYGEPVTVYVVSDNEDFANAVWSESYFMTNVKAYIQTVLNRNSEYSIKLGFGGYSSGEYDIYVSADGETVKYDYFFSDKQSKVDFIKGTAATDDALGVAEIVCQTGKSDGALALELKQKLSLENAESTTAKTFGIVEGNIILDVNKDNFANILLNILKEKETSAPGSVSTLSPAEFTDIMSLAASIEKVNDGSENITTYKTIFGLDEEFIQTYTDKNIDGTDFINYTKNSNLKSVKEANECFKKAVAEYLIVNAKGWNDYITLIESHGDYIGINMDKYNSLNYGEKITDYLTTYSSVNAFKIAVNNIIDAVYEDENPSDNRGSGGGGGFGGGGGTISPKPSIVVSGDISTPPVSLDQTVAKPVFSDVSSDYWGYEAIEYLSKKGVVSGTGNGDFEPDRTVLREEFVKMLVLGLGLEPKDAELEFNDLKSGEWYNDYIVAAYEAGIINGISDTEFGLGLPVSRQDAATMIFRAAKLSKIESAEPFADDTNISDYAKDGVYALREMGIINGVGDDNFAPADASTRAQTAKMIYEYITRGE